MTTIFAAAYIGLWVGVSAGFEVWKRSVNYPPRPTALTLAFVAYEIVGLTVALRVLFG